MWCNWLCMLQPLINHICRRSFCAFCPSHLCTIWTCKIESGLSQNCIPLSLRTCCMQSTFPFNVISVRRRSHKRYWNQWVSDPLNFLEHNHDDVIKLKHFPRYWPFVPGIHRWPVNSPHKGQWREALMFSLINAWINDWVNNHEAGDLRRHRVHYDVIVMIRLIFVMQCVCMCNMIHQYDATVTVESAWWL